MKEIVAREVAALAKSGEVIGIGTGSTVDAAIDALALRIKGEGLKISAVPTSYQSAWRLEQAGIHVYYAGYKGRIDWGFDGADQVDRQGNAIKGRGGAMLKEKILAVRCAKYLLIVDQTKLVAELNGTCPVPVEVIPEAVSFVEKKLNAIGASAHRVRQAVAKHGPVITEAGNVIIDANFDRITTELEGRVKSIIGVVESGLFCGYCDELLVAEPSGVKHIVCKRRA